MARNFDPYRRQRWDWSHRRNRLEGLRHRLFRSSDGKLLGVFKGIAECQGYNACWTRVIGVFALLTLAQAFGARGFQVTVLVAGFFYLLAALLMQPPRRPGESTAAPAATMGAGSVPPPVPPPAPAANPARYPRPRVDLGQLDRQLDGLDRRIQRMENIVTDREYEWNRRMGS